MLQMATQLCTFNFWFETDATTGEWKINTSPSVTYGNNGFFILKDGNSVTDQSGNSNNFTVAGGNLTNSEDCPSDIFNTFNRNLGNNLIPGFTFQMETIELTLQHQLMTAGDFQAILEHLVVNTMQSLKCLIFQIILIMLE